MRHRRAVGVGVLLLAATLVAIPQADPAQFTPFAPHGLVGIGRAALVLFFAFAGWEAVAHLASEFRNVDDVRRATWTTVAIVLSLYLGVAFAVVSTGTYGDPETTRVAVGRMLGDALGISATAVAGVAALVISLATTNAFVGSVSRLGYALGRDRWMPAWVGRVTRRDVPVGGIWTVAGIGAAGLVVAYLTGWSAEDIVVVPSTLVVFTYLAGTAAAARLLSGRARALASGDRVCSHRRRDTVRGPSDHRPGSSGTAGPAVPVRHLPAQQGGIRAVAVCWCARGRRFRCGHRRRSTPETA